MFFLHFILNLYYKRNLYVVLIRYLCVKTDKDGNLLTKIMNVALI